MIHIYRFEPGRTRGQFLRPLQMPSKNPVTNPVDYAPTELEHREPNNVRYPCAATHPEPLVVCPGCTSNNPIVQDRERAFYVHVIVDGEIRIYGIPYELFNWLHTREAFYASHPKAGISVFSYVYDIRTHEDEEYGVLHFDLDRTQDEPRLVADNERPSIHDALEQAFMAAKEK